MADFEIEALLQKVMGLKVTSIGKSTLDRSVQKRMKKLSIKDKDAYLDTLKTSALELKELIEEVVIPETWFFRDHEPFKAMTKFLVTKWAQKHKNNLFRVLSLPCSTGEEPYTLTMTLLGAGWPADKFTVHGVDISHRSIASAKKGIYAENSFRGKDLSYRPKFFKKKKNSYILNKNVRDKVHFHTGNILNRPFIEGLGMFDVIFCRNVMIYFDALSRHQAIATLYKILADDGILFVGHAEANLFNNSPFTPAPYTHAFAFHKKTEKGLKVEAKQPTFTQEPQQKSKSFFGKKFFPFHKRSKKNEPDLKVARKLADEGELQKATEICEEYLDQCGPSAHAFFLLGIIRDAANDTDLAEKLFRKALYLDPNHEESLFFLSLLAEKSGDETEAKNLKLRIARLKSRAALHSSNS
jgi:chemotaxis protein methyltransferase WspC